MKIHELASDYLEVYDGTDVTIIAVSKLEFDNNEFVVAFDLSDGTYWLSDSCDNYQLEESLVGWDIVWVENHGWAVLNEDGSHSEIAYYEDEPLLDELVELYRHVEASLVKINNRSGKTNNPTIGAVACEMEELLGRLQVACKYLGEDL